MTELETLRWGDYQTFPITSLLETAPSIRLNTHQLVAAKWPVPMSWNVILIGFPQLDSSETITFTVTWNFVIGVGGGSMGTVPLFTMTFAPAAGVYTLQQQQQLVPAEALQITATLSTTAPSTATRVEQFTVGAFVAPNNAEIFAEDSTRELVDEVRELRGMLLNAMGHPAPAPEQQPGGMRFMPMGHVDDPLSYQRRRR